MPALTTEINTVEFPTGLIIARLMGSTKIFAGGLVAINASGFAVPAADAAGLKVVGRAEMTVDNSTGGAGDQKITTKRGCFGFGNDATNPCSQSHVGRKVYIKDDNTVQSATGTNSIVAGIMIGFNGTEVIVDTTLAAL